MTSCSEMVEVRAATTSSRKKTVDQTMLSGMPLKMPGSVMKTSEGPDEGAMPAVKTAGKMNLSHLEILSEKSLYKRRRPRADFISRMEQEEETVDLGRDEVLRMNRVQVRYSRPQIEAFIEEHMEDDVMDTAELSDMSEEDFEKLILAYDYSIRRNSRFAAAEDEPEMIQNGRYRYPRLKFIRRGETPE